MVSRLFCRSFLGGHSFRSSPLRKILRDFTPSTTKILRSLLPGWKLKNKSRLKQPAWNDSPTLQDQLCLGSQKERADLEHPFRRGQTDSDSPCVAESLHELGISHWARRGEVDRSAEFVVFD